MGGSRISATGSGIIFLGISAFTLSIVHAGYVFFSLDTAGAGVAWEVTIFLCWLGYVLMTLCSCLGVGILVYRNIKGNDKFLRIEIYLIGLAVIFQFIPIVLLFLAVPHSG